MRTIILCGGLGTRMKEETEFRPKPLVTIGAKPMLWHIMKMYSHFGFSDFVLALGYKGEMIKDYFLNMAYYGRNFVLKTLDQSIEFLEEKGEDWRISFLDTGLETLTGGRVLSCQPYISESEFMLTFGDGVSDINLQDMVSFHRQQKTLATISVFHPYSKYGLVEGDMVSGLVSKFEQKPRMKEYVSGGFMVFQKEALRYFDEGEMENAMVLLAQKKELSFYVHQGFWKAMDTIREREELEALWTKSQPWALWNKK
jgi:glucose-1-phosphate cytidylyltransferase